MIEIANYSLIGNTCVLKLKCTCGISRIFEVDEEGKVYYFCGQCRARKTMEDLKRESSTYWLSRKWKIECNVDERTAPRIHVNHHVELATKATRYSPPYCVLHGQLVVLSETGGLVVAEDFKREYFEDISTVYRNCVLTFIGPSGGVMPSLTGRVVAVRFTPNELPRCRIGIGFENLNEEKVDALQNHIREHIARVKQQS